jgi:hypothetical protein
MLVDDKVSAVRAAGIVAIEGRVGGDGEEGVRGVDVGGEV